MAVRRPAPRSPTRPEPGFYKVRLAPKAWAVPAHLILENGVYSLTLDGDAAGTWTTEQLEQAIVDWLTATHTQPIARLVLYGEPCTETDYRHLLAVKAWAQENSSLHPSLHPMKAMHIRLTPVEEF